MNTMTFEKQTEQVVKALLYGFSFQRSQIVCQSPIVCQGPSAKPDECDAVVGSAASTFDPEAIAKKLRSIGDQYNEDLEVAVQMVIEESSKEKLKKFREMAESLSKSWRRQNPELEYETAFLAVAVKLSLSLLHSAPATFQEEPDLLTQAINGNPEVRGYIERQGGWENFGNRRNQP
ncbi:bcl-2-like protein 15 [Elgaria multicarinata webbii]|uniref:bcl-2-like protein 15 n=1 Tax=Elgaria multicarinata webbii TaxID=159646 RepID=UPI002FCCD680